MSISLSLYDVFSNIVPGLIYLFALNELLKAFGRPQADLLQLSGSGPVLFIILVAFVLGQLSSTFTYERWYRLFIRRPEDRLALEKTAARFPDLKLDFRPMDAEILFSVIQSRSKDIADKMEGYRANAIMMRNISFGLFLIGLAELTRFFVDGYAIGFLGIAVLCFLFSGVAIRGARRFYEWFYRDIFRFSALYGRSYLEVVKKFRKDAAGKQE